MDDKLLLEFLKKISKINSYINTLYLKIEEKKFFKKLNRECEISYRNTIKEQPSIELHISCELPNMLKNIHSLSLNLSIYKENEIWFFDNFIDYDGFDGGYTKTSIEEEYKNLTSLISDVEKPYKKIEASFLKIIDEMISNGTDW